MESTWRRWSWPTVRAPFGARETVGRRLARARARCSDSWADVGGPTRRWSGAARGRRASSRRRRRGGRARCSPTSRCNPGPQPRGRLAARFWPDVLDESARASLRVALTELRQALGPAAGIRGGHAGHGRARRARPQRRRARVSGGARRRRSASARSRRAAPRSSTASTKSGRSRRATSTSHRLADALEQAAAAAPTIRREAVRLTRAEVALDPLAEAPNRRLIERLAATGDRAAALSAGRQFAERLRAQLGIAPSRETRALLDDLRRGEPAPVPPPPGLDARVRDRVRRPPRRARRGCARHGAACRCTATGGSCSSRASPGSARRASPSSSPPPPSQQGATVLLGRCSEEPLAPFEPFTEALAQAGVAEALAAGRQPTTPARAIASSTPSTTRLTDLAARAPLLLVIDDFHWADRGTLLLTSFLLRSSRPGPMLVLGTYRDTELGRHTPLTAALVRAASAAARWTGSTCAGWRWTTWRHSRARCWARDDDRAARARAHRRQRVLRRGGAEGAGRVRAAAWCRRASGTRSASACRAWATRRTS